MPTLGNEINTDSLYSMFKGEFGTRKSTSALSYPKPQYWFSWDRKMRSLLLPMQAWNINPAEIQYDDYEDWDKPRQKLEQLQVNCPFKTIIIDTITSGADGVLRQSKKMKGKDAKKITNIPVNSIEDYNAEDSALSELLALTKDIHSYHKVNIILIAHVMVIEHRTLATNDTHISRSIVTAGKRISLKLPAYCEEVYHFNIEKSLNASVGGNYSLLTTHTGDDSARTSLPLDKKIVFGDDPLYDKWIKPGIDSLRKSLENKPQLPINSLNSTQPINQSVNSAQLTNQSVNQPAK